MDIPHYSVEVSYENTAAGSWTLTAEHNPGGVVAGVPGLLLDDGLTYDWGFVGEQLPGQLEAAVMSFTILATSLDAFGIHADEVNRFIPQRGERMSFLVRIGAAGPVLASCVSARVNEAVLTIEDADPDTEANPYPVSLALTLDDMMLDLAGGVLDQTGGSERATLDRAALIAYMSGISLGMPTAISRVQSLVPRFGIDMPANARDAVASWANSQTTAALQAMVATPYDQSAPARDPLYPAYPAGYSWVGPSNPVGSAIPDPASVVKYMLTPANPHTPVTHKLPLRLAVVDGLLSLTNAPSSDTRTAAVNAAVCELPTSMRSTREHVPNVFQVVGEAEWLDVAPTPDQYNTRPLTIAVVPDADEVSARGPVPRQVQTQLKLGTYDGTLPEDPSVPDLATAAAAAAPFAATTEQLSEPWAVDKVKILASELPQAEAESLLPMLTPGYPGELESDGVLLRHLTVYNRPDRVAALSLDGWIVAGRMTIADGELTYEVTTQPGQPTYSVATRITVGDVLAASWHAHPAGDIDPNISVADLAYVDA